MSIKANGGAVRYWRNVGDGVRAVLCSNGKILLYMRSRWRESEFLDAKSLDGSEFWKSDTRPSLSAAITRTSRAARRL